MSIFGSIFGGGCQQETPEQKRVREMHEFHKSNCEQILCQFVAEGKPIQGFVYSGDAMGGYKASLPKAQE